MSQTSLSNRFQQCLPKCHNAHRATHARFVVVVVCMYVCMHPKGTSHSKDTLVVESWGYNNSSCDDASQESLCHRHMVVLIIALIVRIIQEQNGGINKERKTKYNAMGAWVSACSCSTRSLSHVGGGGPDRLKKKKKKRGTDRNQME